MRPLLQQASRSLLPNAARFSPSLGGLASTTRSTRFRCQYRAASTVPHWTNRTPLSPARQDKCSGRPFSSSRSRWEDKKPPSSTEPIYMPPPAPKSSPSQQPQSQQGAYEDDLPLELQERIQRLREESEAQARLKEEQAARERKKQEEEAEARRQKEEAEAQARLKAEAEVQRRLKEEAEAPPKVKEPPAPAHVQQRPVVAPKKHEVVDNVTRVPDEQLPSHRERQRWNLSKRLSDAMDDLLPKLAVVTQKVNTYTGTDYSSIEALRKEIKDQEKLVKARRLAIDTAREALDAAQSQQAASQKEVVALLERKHSWSSGDLERYMSLIRSEHINDRAVRQAKEALAAAEDALEEARGRLEKRERAQYHEEQIWSDTIRRNSTWVTFGLMGVNIFLLLLSLVILEPWRRKRMVREIKSTLEAQKVASESVSAPASTLVAVPAATPNDAAVAEAVPIETTTPIAAEPVIEESPTAETEIPMSQDASLLPEAIPENTTDLAAGLSVHESTSVTPDEAEVLTQETIEITEPKLARTGFRDRLEMLQEKVTTIAQDVVSERPISLRRIDFTTAMVQSAAAGAVIAAALIAMLRPY